MAKAAPEGERHIAMQLAAADKWRDLIDLSIEMSKTMDEVETNAAHEIFSLIREGLLTDGAHHKQWYLHQVGLKLGFYLPTEEEDGPYDPGIPG